MPAGKAGDRDLHLVLLLPLVEPLGGTLPGGVGVERQHHPAGVALQQPHVVLGERRAARRHRPLDAGAVEPDHVGVALAHDDLVRRDDVGLRPVQPVQRLGLGVDRRLRRVLVLRRVVGAGQDAAAERHRLAVLAEDREQHPGPEGVLHPVAAVAERQPRVCSRSAADAGLARQRVPVVGRPAELELAGDVTGEAAASAGSRGPRGRAGSLSSRSWYQSTARSIASTRCLRWARSFDWPVEVYVSWKPASRGQQLDGADEVDVLDLLDEREHVAALATAEALVATRLSRTLNDGDFSAWNGHSPTQLRPDLAQRDHLADDVDDRDRRAQPLDVLVDDRHAERSTGSSRSRSARSGT